MLYNNNNLFNRLLPQLVRNMQEFVCNGRVSSAMSPLLTHRALQQAATEEVLSIEKERLEALLSALEAELWQIDCKEKLLRREPVDMNIGVTGAPGQSRDSLNEQRQTFNLLKSAIDEISTLDVKYEKGVLISGGPGAGKTYLFMLACLYASSKGLRVMTTALTSERARKLGGLHLHMLFDLPVSSVSIDDNYNMAEKTLAALLKKPVKIALLQRLDCLFIDEIGLLSGNLVSVIDYVLRQIRGNDEPFGGVLVIATGDQEQLRPIEGVSFFSSTFMAVSFRVVVLKHLVRSQNDNQLQEAIRILRDHELCAKDKMAVLGPIITDNCEFHESWDSIPEKVLRIVGE